MSGTRLTDVSTRSFDLALATPLSTAAGEIRSRTGHLVRVRATTAAGESLAGVGEATPLPGWTEGERACRDTLATVCDRVSGESLRSAWRAVNGIDDTPAARHGLAGALADLEARRDGESLAASLAGAEPPTSVAVNATVGDAPRRETAERARAAVDEGFDCLKLKVGARPVEADLERIAAVREAVGGDVSLRVDANAAWTRPTAEQALDRIAERDLRVDYLEQPLAADDLDGHAALRDREATRPAGTRIALDESLTATDPGTALSAGAADVLVLKPTALGGPDRAVAAARMALAEGVTPVVTTTVDAVVARTTAVHVAAAVEAAARAPTAHGLATGSMLSEDLAPDPAPVENGRIRVPEGPGTGVEGVFD